MKHEVTDRDIITTGLARLYMSSPKRLRKYARPWIRSGIKIERKAEKSAKIGNEHIRYEVSTRTKRLIGIGKTFTTALGSSKKKK